MADLTTNFAGIRCPNPFRLASGRPEWRAFPGGAGSGGVGGICAVPVLAGVGTVAVIELFAEDGTAPADVVLDALHTVGVVAGRIAERAMAADELRRMRAELEARAAVRPEPAGVPVAAAPVAAPPAFRDAPKNSAVRRCAPS